MMMGVDSLLGWLQNFRNSKKLVTKGLKTIVESAFLLLLVLLDRAYQRLLRRIDACPSSHILSLQQSKIVIIISLSPLLWKFSPRSPP